ncbi:MAG: GGDEF domain-containing protein [Gammaproteobacteria bacterium]|nr:GGDEF domain-containing protein [Gammaproteobacteria bacterium]
MPQKDYAHRSCRLNNNLSLLALYYRISDVISTLHHSVDFVQTRNNYVIERLQLMILFFVITVPLSAVFDYFLFDQVLANLLMIDRIVLSFSLLGLVVVIKQRTSIYVTRLCLALAFCFPMLFYVASTVSLEANLPTTEIPVSFVMMPYLIIAMLGLFPLTVIGGLLLLLVILVPMLVVEFGLNSTDLVGFSDQLWLFIMFGGISLWLQTGQLVMLMKLYRESTVDPLTGLINRRVLMRQLEQVSNLKSEKASNYSVLMCDLDHFKRINDGYGHMIGDKVLVLFAQILKTQLRQLDIISRVGGEEFFVVMPNINEQQGVEIAERIASVTRNALVESIDGQKVKVTVSIGVTQYRQGESISSVFNRADQLLYRAKTSGRDSVMCDQQCQSPSRSIVPCSKVAIPDVA